MNGESEYWRGVNNYKAREAWAVLLASYSWDAYFTATVASSTLRLHALSINDRVKRSAMSVSPVSRLFIAAEEHYLGGWHSHGLVKWDLPLACDLPGSTNFEFARRLSHTGYCCVQPANSVTSVATYLSKYVVKDAPWEWDFAGSGWGSFPVQKRGIDK